VEHPSDVCGLGAARNPSPLTVLVPGPLWKLPSQLRLLFCGRRCQRCTSATLGAALAATHWPPCPSLLTIAYAAAAVSTLKRSRFRTGPCSGNTHPAMIWMHRPLELRGPPGCENFPSHDEHLVWKPCGGGPLDQHSPTSARNSAAVLRTLRPGPTPMHRLADNDGSPIGPRTLAGGRDGCAFHCLGHQLAGRRVWERATSEPHHTLASPGRRPLAVVTLS